MAVIRPFNALRPTQNLAHLVASVPYDVVNTEEAKELAANNEHTLLRVTRSEIEFPANTNPYSDDIYKKAAENLNKLISKGSLINDAEDRIYLYKLEMDGRTQTGIAATFSVDDYDNDVIMKHEKTRKEKEDDRTKHIVTTGAQTGPVFLTYRGSATIDSIVKEVCKDNQPLYMFTAPDGIKHTVWVLPTDYNDTFVSEIKAIDKLYIADGHHRAASASRARAAKKEANKAHKGSEEYNYFIAVLFPADQLAILPYNRVVTDLNGKTKEEFLNEISEKFMVEQVGQKTPHDKRTFSMYLDGNWYMIKVRDAVLASLSLSKSVGDQLDVSILQSFLLNPILGIDDPRTNKRVDFVGGIRGTAELEKLVNSKKFAVAFSMFPVTVDDLMNISDAGEIMPPKSTWFEPKLRDGLLIHQI